jgi:hypothetical protein
MRIVFTIVVLCSLLTSLLTSIGCQPNKEKAPTARAAGSAFVLAEEPGETIPVGTAKESTKDGDDVVVLGLVGGSTKPFVEGLAAFTIVDPKVPYCADDEGCPTPWDYCCQSDAVRQNIATVKLVDSSGKPVMQGARELLPVKELSTVVVQGIAKRDEQGNLTIAARHVFVRPGK